MDYPQRLNWQSKLVSLLVLPLAAVEVLLLAFASAQHAPAAAAWTLGLSFALGLIAWISHAGTPMAALAGSIITASLMFSTTREPFAPWRTGLVPVLAFLLLTTVATHYGRGQKERLGIAEERRGRVAAQVCANLGFAALIATPPAQIWMADAFPFRGAAGSAAFIMAIAALAEAAADTLSSEIGQVAGGTPVMLTSFRRVPPGTDGAISVAGTVAGVMAAGAVAVAGAWAMQFSAREMLLAWFAGVFGLFFDSLLGATLERRGWLNNDAVNFLSTASASVFTLLLIAAIG
jgi:uncharacterized protein (TIGR00297 family)